MQSPLTPALSPTVGANPKAASIVGERGQRRWLPPMGECIRQRSDAAGDALTGPRASCSLSPAGDFALRTHSTAGERAGVRGPYRVLSRSLGQLSVTATQPGPSVQPGSCHDHDQHAFKILEYIIV